MFRPDSLVKKLKGYRYDLGLIWLAALIASTLAPFYLISQQPAEFGYFEFGSFIAFSLLIALFFGALGTLVYGLLAALTRNTWARSFALFVLFWTTITAFVFPVVRTAGMLEAVDLRRDYVNLLLALGFTITCVRLVVSKHFLGLPFIFLAFLVPFTLSDVVPQLYQFSRHSEAVAITRADFLSLSRDENVVVLSFDDLPGNVVRKVFSERPELRDAFKDFIFFDEAIALAPATRESITGELFGNRNYRDIGDTQEQVLEHLDSSTLPFNRVAKAGAAVFTYGVYNLFNVDRAKQLDSGDIYGGLQGDVLQDSTTFLEYAVGRMATGRAVKLLRGLGLTRYAIAALTTTTGDELWLRLLEHKGSRWDISYIKQKLDLEAFIANVGVGRSGRYVAYMHFLHTHFPVDLDRTCEYRSDDETWHLQNQSEAGTEGEAICALTQAARLIDRLQALGVYEKTFLVIKSDHGKPTTYYHEAPHNYEINGHAFLGLNRYRPLLMVKDRGRLAPRIEVVSEWVTLGDLAKTMCLQLLGSGPVCDPFLGVNLVGERDIRQDSVIYVNVVKDEESNFNFDTHLTVELNRTLPARTFVDLLRQADEVELSAPSENAD
jgi:hypothetical protein